MGYALTYVYMRNWSIFMRARMTNNGIRSLFEAPTATRHD